MGDPDGGRPTRRRSGRSTWAEADSAITRAFADGPALVAYVVGGDPGPGEDHSPGGVAETKAHVRALAAGGADVVELGLPFSEPIAEGTPIQNGIRRALDAGMTPDRYLDLVADLDVDVPVVCMTYYNLLYQYGLSEALRASGNASGQRPRASGADPGPEPFVAAAAEAGLAGFIVPDLPVEESGPLRAACDDHGLDLVQIVAPTTRGERLDRVLDACQGFVYVQSRLGTTGARTDVSDQTYESLARLGETDLPTAVGFGVSRGEHAREIVAGGADGVVAGSVFVDAVADAGGAADGDPDAGDGSGTGDATDRSGTADPTDRLEAIARELASGANAGLPKPERT